MFPLTNMNIYHHIIIRINGPQDLQKGSQHLKDSKDFILVIILKTITQVTLNSGSLANHFKEEFCFSPSRQV